MQGRRRKRVAAVGLGGLLALSLSALLDSERETPRRRPEARAPAARTAEPGAARAAAAAAAPSARTEAGAAQPESPPEALPGWLEEWLREGGGAPIATNRALSPRAASAFDPRDLRALQDIIDANALGEASSAFDFDDGDGRLEPWELGFQAWQQGRLVALSFGPDPHVDFGYELSALPESLGDLNRLRYLDLAGQDLAALPEGLGDLRELRELRVNRNHLESLPESIGELRELRALNASRNQIAWLPPGFADLDRLERLHLDDNPFPSLPPELAGSESLREIGITRAAEAMRDESAEPGGPALTALPAEVVGLPALETLHATGQALCGAPASGGAGSAQRVLGLSAQRCAAAAGP
jgi:hypothetical protein